MVTGINYISPISYAEQITVSKASMSYPSLDTIVKWH